MSWPGPEQEVVWRFLEVPGRVGTARHYARELGLDAGVVLSALQKLPPGYVTMTGPGEPEARAIRFNQIEASRRYALRKELVALAAARGATAGARLGDLVGRSEPMRRVFGAIAQVNVTGADILLQGDTGTGKDLAARTLHQRSLRAEKPFVVVDCTRLPPKLIESELFGSERGAYTDAVSRPGFFEQASGGTVFLNEIGDLRLDLQSKLLGVLDTREVTRIGGRRPVSVDVRVIAATLCDLSGMIKNGQFRADLYFRLDRVSIRMPRLCERPDDLPLLIESIIDDLCAKPGYRRRQLSGSAMALLHGYQWPGNIRELQSVIMKLLNSSDAEEIAAEELDWLGTGSEKKMNGDADAEGSDSNIGIVVRSPEWPTMDDVERAYIEKVLRHNQYRRAETARVLGMTPDTLRAKIGKYSIVVPVKA